LYLLTSKYVLNSHFALACFVGNLLHACTLLDKKCICTSLYNLCHRLHRDDSIGEEYVCPLFHCYLDEAMDSLFHLCFNWTPPHPGPRNTTTARGLTVFWCQAVSSRRRRGFSLLLLINADKSFPPFFRLPLFVQQLHRQKENKHRQWNTTLYMY